MAATSLWESGLFAFTGIVSGYLWLVLAGAAAAVAALVYALHVDFPLEEEELS
jgi:hypothetical protein